MHLRLLLLFLLSLHQVSGQAQEVEFIFAYDTQQGFPAFMGKGLEVPEKYPGTYIEILREVARRVPIKLTLTRLPWERCKAYLAQNRVSGINSSYKKERARMGVFPRLEDGRLDRSKRITSDAYRIYTKRGSGLRYDASNIKVLPEQSLIAAPLGYSIVEYLAKHGLQVEQHPDGVEGVLRLLVYGRVQGVIAHQSQMQFVLNQTPDFAEVIVPVEPAVQEKDYFILISRAFYRSHPELARAIWREIEDLRETLLPQLEQDYRIYYGR